MMNKINLATGRKIEVMQEKCMKCGLCKKLCPTNNIKMNDFPQFNKKCELCMRCISFCPTKAITILGKEFIRYKAVNVSEL